MLKKWIVISMVLCLSMFLVLPALAQEETGFETDQTAPEPAINDEDPGAAGSVDDSVVQEDSNGETRIDGFYCRTPEATHPVVSAIADRYGVTYEEVLAFFCGSDPREGSEEEATPHYGLGVIALAYETSLVLEDGTTAADLLAMKSEMGGWGKVWQSLGFKGRPDKGNGHADHAGPPENAGKPDKSEKSPGKPDHAGGPNK